MPSFSDSFWSQGYAPGVAVLFDKLQQGCEENDQVLALAAARADAEDLYAAKLRDISALGARQSAIGFSKDDGASLRKAYEGITQEMGEEGRHHAQVAENIRRMVLLPFGRWADEHKQRVNYSSSVLKGKLKAHDKGAAEVQKAQKRYFNKCRVLEDELEREKLEQAESGGETGTVPEPSDKTEEPSSELHQLTKRITSDSQAVDAVEESVGLAGVQYTADEAQVLFKKLLSEIPQTSTRVAILGTYDNVSTGADIVEWAHAHISGGSLPTAEAFGQGLVDQGYLRLIGQVGSRFANSSVLHYQWRRPAYLRAGLQPPVSSQFAVGGFTLAELSASVVNGSGNGDETVLQRLQREVAELDTKYREAVVALDDARCQLEEAVVDHFTFMERCEYDRLKANKAVLLDFLAAMSNVVPSIQATVDKLLLFQEAVHPKNDLRYVLEQYRTGLFSPKVTVYDNYYNSTENQTFGVDLELRCRSDRRRVPFLVSGVLSHMDSQYPVMENDQVRLGAWTVAVPLKSTHELRRILNVGRLDKDHPFPGAQLQSFTPPVVASVLKLYLVELPDSLVPSQYYDVVKSIYASNPSTSSDDRIQAIQSMLAQLRVSNIATLDAICTHLHRVISITNADEDARIVLAQEFSHCVLRPRVQSALTINDRHAYRLMYDLIVHKEEIFAGLRRNNSKDRSISSASTISTSSHLPTPNLGQGPASVIRRPTLQNRLDALSIKIRNKPVQLHEKAVDTDEEVAIKVEAEPNTHDVSSLSTRNASTNDLSTHDSDAFVSADEDSHLQPRGARHGESLTDHDITGDRENPIVVD